MNASSTTRRGFLFGTAAATAAPLFAKAAGDFDDRTTLFLADLHIRGDRPWYSEGLLRDLIAEVLRLRPLPRRCVVLGDIAYLFGRAKDYELAAELIGLLEAAGIAVTLGLGNHDRRETFVERFPKQAVVTKVPGRVVSEVALDGVDVLVLDSLRRPDEGKGVVPGEIGGGQLEWLADDLPRRTRPVIVCAHHSARELQLVKMLEDAEAVAGYVYGHHHRWIADWTAHNSHGRPVRTCCLPCASLWGDIGYALLRTEPGRARMRLVQRDYVAYDFRDQTPVRPPNRAAALEALMEDRRRGAFCSFAI